MGNRRLDLEMPTDYTYEDLKRKVCKILKINNCRIAIERKSLDARDKRKIHWKVKSFIESPELEGGLVEREETIEIPHKKRDKRVVVVGSGPAGFFSAYVLALAGYDVTIIEQGSDVDTRAAEINKFELSGKFPSRNNYAYGEGGAGTFSDGKLTSRSKHISAEKKFIFDTYVSAGAPEEISYLSHPHIGSDNLIIIARRLREMFWEKGGEIRFDTKMTGIVTANGTITAVETDKGVLDTDYLIIAPGHSSFDTYEMLIRKGVKFEVKSFAIGCRAEHPQELINISQWGRASVKGLKAAEYKLTYNNPVHYPVYSFCMCPGGKVVPASPESELNIVNGMSNYMRDSKWANSGIVAGINFNEIYGRDISPLQAIEKLREIERAFFDFSKSYAAPANKISDFINGRSASSFPENSYPFRLIHADYKELLPRKIVDSLIGGMKDFCRKIRGYEDGIMLGLESKTSSPIKSLRDDQGRCLGFPNLWLAGEGSGLAGGIVSSAADGIKAALSLIRNDS